MKPFDRAKLEVEIKYAERMSQLHIIKMHRNML